MGAEDTKVSQRETELEKEEVTLNDLFTRLTKLETNIAELTQLFKEKIDRDEAKRGFMYQGIRLLRPEIVVVAKYEEGGREENG